MRPTGLMALRNHAARQSWEAGTISPSRITLALDLRGLQGPGVDRALGVDEPTVDLWESGDLYPTWEQLLRLATLCAVPVAFFAQPAYEPLGHTTLCVHLGCVCPDVEWVPRFSRAALVVAGKARPSSPDRRWVHSCPEVDSTDRMHVMEPTCWCQPDVRGDMVIHAPKEGT